MKNLASYPKISTMGLKIYEEPYPHVLASDLRKVLTKERQDKFQKLCSFKTVLHLDNGEVGIYPWDVENLLLKNEK